MIELRALLPSDLDVLQRLERACHPFPWNRTQLLAELEHGDAVCVGAVDVDDPGGHLLVGHLVLRRILDELWILNIATHPQHRRRGVGHKLMGRALATQDALGAAGPPFPLQGGSGPVALWLEVRESNGAARELYERHGLVTVGRRPGYYRPVPPSTKPEAAILMSRPASEGGA